MVEPDLGQRVRIDKWLWAARFFKTRAQAAAAVSGGLVQVDGQRVKPSRQVAAGEMLRITRRQEVFVVLIKALAVRRGPASQARALYEETGESQLAREERRRERRLLGEGPGMFPAGRPSKRGRRLIRRFVRGETED